MKIAHQVVVFDAADLAAESSFWAGVLGGTVDAEDDWHMVKVDGRPRVGVQLAPNHVRPDWPHGTPQQIHLDLWIDDPVAGHDLVMALGATVLQEVQPGDAPDAFQVYADPAGHPFCLCWIKPTDDVPSPEELAGKDELDEDDEMELDGEDLIPPDDSAE